MRINCVIVSVITIVILLITIGVILLYVRLKKSNHDSGHKKKTSPARKPDSEHHGSNLDPSSDVTIGLWHESVPGSTWGKTEHSEFLEGPTGFKAYSELYVNYVSNIVKVAQKKGVKLGEFYFSIDDPITIDPSTKQISSIGPAYYYGNVPKTGRPMINEYLIQPLGEIGITKFGLVVGHYNKYNIPWGWSSSKYPTNQIKKGTIINGIPVAIDSVSIESLFKLVAELNDDLAAHGSKLFIQYLGFDNESFGNIFPSQGMDKDGWKCLDNAKGVNGVLTADNVINYLWDYYMNMKGKKWATSDHNWGNTGASPTFYAACPTKDMKKTADSVIPGSSRNFAFIEWYNLPGDTAAIKTVDHPSFAPNNPFWTADVTYFADSGYTKLLPTNIDESTKSKLLKYNAYYGLNTPQRKRKIMNGLTRWDPSMSEQKAITYFDQFYSQQPVPSLKQIITGLTTVPDNIIYPLTSYRDTVDAAFIKYIFDAYNQKKVPQDENGNWDTVASNYNKVSRNDSYVDVSDGTRWMLSLENFSSSYGTIKQDGLKQLTNDSTLAAEQVDIDAPTSSVALKFAGNGGPFTQTGKIDSPYDLLKFGQASGTFEAFGAWELEEIMDFMLYSNKNVVDINKPTNRIVKNFMLYEFNFVQLRQCSTNYAN